MLKRSCIHIIIAILILISSSGLQAGYYSDSLEHFIDGRAADEFVRVLIIPVSDHDAAAFKSSLASDFSTRAERHRAGIARLKEVAATTQASINNRLADLELSFQAMKIKAFWITNLIEAEITVSGLERLLMEPSVERIELYPTIVSIPDPVSTRLSSAVSELPANLLAVKADSAWAAGYDGRGRIICSFDTGVDGLHPALYDNYRGNKGYSASQCWFSPVDSSTYPHVFATAGSKKSHGTHTTGLIVGHDDDSGDTIGVAPGADWIAAVAIDVPGASIFQSFQWAVDPDGDPNTVSDIPDVINHSWGVPGIGCADIFWEVIDNSEALGIVNIFAAGNEGLSPFTIRNPANRAEDSLTNFAVGALSNTFESIWFQSSVGPSDCDSVSIKPNVVAPGQTLRSSVADGGYAYASGTSGAAPHVSGAVAIMRQKNPDATVDEIKTALLASAHDMGDPGADNTFGWGRIDIMEALRLIDPIAAPLIQIAALPYPEINPGDAISLDLALKNIGAPVTRVTATFQNMEEGVTVSTNKISFGTIGTDEVIIGATTLELEFDLSVEPGRFYSMDMVIDGDGYSDVKRLNFFVGSRGERTYFHHETDRVKFSISNYGAFGFYGYSGASALIGSFIPLGFDGYQLDRDTNDLFEAALIIGVDSLHVSDCAKNIAQEPDNDFAVAPGGSIAANSPGINADQQTVSRFDDRYAEHPIGLTVEQRSYSWTADPDNTFVILEYIITNTSKAGVNGVRIGLFLDWDIRYYSQNHGSFLPGEDIGYMCWNNSDSADFRGVKVLNPEGLTNHRMYNNPTEVYYSNFTEARKYQGLAENGFGTMATNGDYSHITATGPFNLAENKSDTAAFAIIGGADWNSFLFSADRAESRYNDIPTAIDDQIITHLPRTFTLHQNYPNPFNPATTISLAIPKAGMVRVEIFDILGRRIRTLADQYFSAGEVDLEWNGCSEDDEAVASGIYFYRVSYNGNSMTRQMVMMK